MIPSITPPTDNLYKFLSLFGLTIFLFAIYNLGAVYDKSATSKIRIEAIKIDVQKKLYAQSSITDETFAPSLAPRRFQPARIRLLGEDLKKIQSAIIKAHFMPMVEIELIGRVSKLKIEVDALSLKFWTYFGITLLGLVVMIFGFARWLKREQNLRDRILAIEHALKEKEQYDAVQEGHLKSKQRSIPKTEEVVN